MLVGMRSVVLFLGVSLVGCATDIPNVSESRSAIVIDNKLAANKLAANKLAANKLAANKLQLNNLAAADLLATDEGREVLSFIVSCAIEEGQTLVGTYAGVDYEFFGDIGLANKWLDQPVDQKGEGWVSACLFSRVNAASVPIPISLRGAHPALVTDATEVAEWTLQEGAFYGNFFTDEGQPIDWNACRGRDQAAGETGGLVARDCAEPDPANPGLTLCGFNYAGDCGNFAEHYACKKFDTKGTFYKKCAASDIFSARGQGHDDDDDDRDGNRTYAQVITTYVLP